MKALDPATVTLYLTVLALAIKFALGALQSGTFNSLLARFSLPPIPTAVFPWLGALLGLAAGVVTGLQGGDTIAIAIGQALVTTLTGGIAAMHLQFVSGRDPVVSGGPPKPSPTKQSVVEVPATQIEAKAPAARRGMIRGALVGAVSALLVVALLVQPACKGSALPVAENIVAVVLADLQAGKSDAQIAADVCAALGGSSATDAVCSGAEQLVADVIVYLIDSGTISNPALANAQAYQARHPAAAKAGVK